MHPLQSLSSRRAWIEIAMLSALGIFFIASLSSRRAWIEIYKSFLACSFLSVALLTESVDWNHGGSTNIKSASSRSPHGERGLKCVSSLIHEKSFKGRSPHGERGLKYILKRYIKLRRSRSLSSRRAWIEIAAGTALGTTKISRSPHGERGLKFQSKIYCYTGNLQSLSSRRAWIEIRCCMLQKKNVLQVALLTESVDWNQEAISRCSKPSPSLSSRRAWIEILNQYQMFLLLISRSPHGERGLKSNIWWHRVN